MNRTKQSRRAIRARRNRQRRHRLLPTLENLEARMMLAGDWQNPANSLDVTDDGLVVPLDVLTLINELNNRTIIDRNGRLPVPATPGPPPFLDPNGDDLLVPLDVLQVINAFNNDTEAPIISAQLMSDTAPGGGTNDDGVTSDDRIQGSVTDTLGVQSLQVRIDGGSPTSVPFDRRSGNFVFAPQLAADGPHSLSFIATDPRGTTSEPTVISVTLDTQAPAQTTLNLSDASDSEPKGDGRTDVDIVSLIGQTEPGAKVELTNLQLEVTADSAGSFQFDNVALNDGDNLFSLEVTDPAGNTAQFEQTISLDAPGTMVLVEQSRFVTEQSMLVELGQPAGSRTISFELESDFDISDGDPAVEDQFSVYLVSAFNSSQTLLDRGRPGTSLFSLGESSTESAAGLVRFDGSTVEIDATGVGGSQARLVFQLLNGDEDNGSRVIVRNVHSTVDPEGSAGTLLSTTNLLADIGDEFDLTSMSAISTVDFRTNNIRFDSRTGRYAAEFQLVNTGPGIGRELSVAFPELPDGVTILNPSGTSATHGPYLNLLPSINSGGLPSGASTESFFLELNNPGEVRFLLEPTILSGGPNVPPSFDTIPSLSVMPGETFRLNLSATDPNPDDVVYSLLVDDALPNVTVEANGSVTITPHPDQIGSYDITFVASDGVAGTTQTVSLDVVADPITTTRVSGIVETIEQLPLAGVPVAIGDVEGTTAADGTFTLETSGSFTSDTLRIHAEALTGAETYPFIAENLPLVLGHDLFASANNVIERPIYIPALDMANAKTIDPAADTVVTTDAISGAALMVQAGTLQDPQGNTFDGQVGITAVPRDLTPAALPANLRPDNVVTIQPGDMVFTTPAPLNLPNDAGYRHGSIVELWSINPATGDFDVVGKGRVNGDVIQTIEGGVRTSSWHFFSPEPPDPIDISAAIANQDLNCEEQVFT